MRNNSTLPTDIPSKNPTNLLNLKRKIKTFLQSLASQPPAFQTGNCKQGITVLLIILSLLAVEITHAHSLPESIPGGVVLIPLDVPAQPPPTAHFQDKRVLVFQAAKDKNWLAAIGIPLTLPPGRYQLSLAGAANPAFNVLAHDYPEEHLTVKNKRHVNPLAEDWQRIQRETKQLRQSLQHWSAIPLQSITMTLPAAGRLSSPFGLKRYFNGQARAPHSGLDIAAPLGTAVTASLAGEVINTGHYFFNGKTVIVDHGQGLLSLYCHLQTIDSHSGQTVNVGDRIGRVGMTGRATGPHLHWTVILNGNKIDPQQLLASG